MRGREEYNTILTRCLLLIFLSLSGCTTISFDDKTPLKINNNLPPSSEKSSFHLMIVPRVTNVFMPTSVATGKFDEGPIMDFAITTQGDITYSDENEKAGSVTIVYGEDIGKGTFLTPVEFPGGRSVAFSQTADLNLDGWEDIVIVSTNAREINVKPWRDEKEIFQQNEINLNQFTNDLGRIPPGRITVLLNDGYGNFRIHNSFSPVLGFPFKIVIGDFNQDNFPDILCGNLNEDSSSVEIFWGKGDGNLSPIPYKVGGFKNQSVSMGHFDNDDTLDGVVLSADGRENSQAKLTFLLSNGDKSFTNHVLPLGTITPLSITTGDFNGDKKDDVIIRGEKKISILLSDGEGNFDPIEPFSIKDDIFIEAVEQSPLRMGTIGHIQTGDFDLDGKLDILINNSLFQGLSILYGNGEDGFLHRQNLNVGTYSPKAWFGIPDATDFNGDGLLDVIVPGFYYEEEEFQIQETKGRLFIFQNMN